MSLTRENLTDDQRDVMRKITRADEEARETFFTAVEKIRRDSGMEELGRRLHRLVRGLSDTPSRSGTSTRDAIL